MCPSRFEMCAAAHRAGNNEVVVGNYQLFLRSPLAPIFCAFNVNQIFFCWKSSKGRICNSFTYATHKLLLCQLFWSCSLADKQHIIGLWNMLVLWLFTDCLILTSLKRAGVYIFFICFVFFSRQRIRSLFIFSIFFTAQSQEVRCKSSHERLSVKTTKMRLHIIVSRKHWWS